MSWGTPAERIERVGNLAIDGALLEAQSTLETDPPEDGILMMPGSRGYEVENLIPFYFTTALRIARRAAGDSDRVRVLAVHGVRASSRSDRTRRRPSRLRAARPARRRRRTRVSRIARRHGALSDPAQFAGGRVARAPRADDSGNEVHRACDARETGYHDHPAQRARTRDRQRAADLSASRAAGRRAAQARRCGRRIESVQASYAAEYGRKRHGDLGTARHGHPRPRRARRPGTLRRPGVGRLDRRALADLYRGHAGAADRMAESILSLAG